MPALLHAMTHFSLMNGVLSVEQLCKRAVALGYTALALTDRDNLYALPEFLRQCRAYALRPIIGAEITNPGSGVKGSVLVYANGETGYSNLCQVISSRQCDTPFRLVDQLKNGGSDGLFVVGEDCDYLIKIQEVSTVYYRLKSLKALPARVKSGDISALVIPWGVYEKGEDQHTHRLLRAIADHSTLPRVVTGEQFGSDSVITSWESICCRFAVFEQALEQTVRFGEGLVSRDTFGALVFPRRGSASEARNALRELALRGAMERYGEINDVVSQRLEYELSVIGSKGFDSYFLVVKDIVDQSPRTCGRGSGAASIVSYCLGITNVDPIRYNLMFERFLNEGRKDPPDIDIDFAWDERDKVLEYALNRYGKERAAMICTHNTFGARMALRESARVYGLNETEISTVTKRLPHYFFSDTEKDDLDTHLRQSPSTAGMLNLDPPWPQVIADAQRLIGRPCSIGTHCGGVVITPGPIRELAPVQISPKGVPVVQWEKDGAEDMGLVKIDLLGNRSLAVIRDTIANLRGEGIAFDERRWDPASDPATIDLLARGKTMGVFYVESPAMRLLQERTGTGDFEHMIIHSSIIRPAANRFIREYIRRLKGGTFSFEHPLLAQVLAETYGIMVYQEDVTRVAMQLSDFSIVEADSLRKVLARKNRHGALRDLEERFAAGARRKGVSDECIGRVWAMMMSFAGYSFCKPHSASYVQVSFQSAWLKCHYPAAFMAAVIGNFGGFYTTQAYISEAQRLGVIIDPPDCNESQVRSFATGRAIRIGLNLIKGLGAEAQQAIVRIRQSAGRYLSLEDFLSRTALTQGEAETLISAGACDCLVPDRSRPSLFWRLRMFFRGAGVVAPPQLEVYSRRQYLGAQYRALGFLADVHPMELARPAQAQHYPRIAQLRGLDGRAVTFCGWCVTTRTVTTINGEAMQFVTFEDETGIIEAVLFPPQFRQFTRHILSREGFFVTGKVVCDMGATLVECSGIGPIGKVVQNNGGAKSCGD